MKKKIVDIASILLAIVGTRYWDKKILDNRNAQLNLLRMQRDILDHWLTMKERMVSLDFYLKKIDCKKIGIYGLSLLGNHLYEELHHSEYVTKLVGIDQADIYDNFEMELVKPGEPLDDIELVIVTAISDYSAVESLLKTCYAGKIMSIQQVINECEKFYSYTM